MTIDAHWNAVYGRKADVETSWHQDDPEPSLGLILSHPSAAGRGVIDIGAGRSVLADRLIGAGLTDLALLDVSEEALAQVARRLDGGAAPELIVADVARWRPTRRWGVWHDRAVLHFLVDPAARKGYRAALHAGTGPGSVVVLATFAEDGPERCSGLPVRRYGAEEMAEAVGDAFEPLSSQRVAHVSPGGARQMFRYGVFRRH